MNSIVAAFMETAEDMEMEQALVLSFLQRFKREDIVDAFWEVPWEDVVAEYSTDTFYRIAESGTNLAFNTNCAKYMNALVKRVETKLYPVTVPTTQGMGEDGLQS